MKGKGKDSEIGKEMTGEERQKGKERKRKENDKIRK